MGVSTLFGIGLGFTVAVSAVVVRYLQRPLDRILTELCGNRERAEFWTAFSSVTVGLTPIIFALSYPPDTGSCSPALLEIASQLKWGLIGMVISVVLLGWVLSRFIPRRDPKA